MVMARCPVCGKTVKGGQKHECNPFIPFNVVMSGKIEKPYKISQFPKEANND